MTPQTTPIDTAIRTHTHRARGRLIVGAMLAAAIAAGTCGSARAAGDLSVSFTGVGEHAFTVPAGVTMLHVVAVGGRGFGPNGFGAQASGDVAVTPGQVLYAEVGGNGGAPNGISGGAGGANGGGAGGLTFNGGTPLGEAGGGGGGASDLRGCPLSESTCDSLASRVLVAGGGGGFGGATSGGNGGTPDGQDGQAIYDGTGAVLHTGYSGYGGTLQAGGAGGTGIVDGDFSYGGLPGRFGAGGLGGRGYSYAGGGGGGGYYGGGGGTGATPAFLGGDGFAGGGGGGSSYGPAGTTFAVGSDANGYALDPSVTLSWTDTSAPVVQVDSPAGGASYPFGAAVTATYSCTDDGGSGLATCTGDVASGQPLDTSIVGEHTFTVTATDGAGNRTSSTVFYTILAPAAPSNTSPPAVQAPSTLDGTTLSAKRGSWQSDAPTTYAYRWQRCDATGQSCADITGATKASYRLTHADVGATIDVAVDATNAGGTTTKTSNPTAQVTPNPAKNTVPPTITGTAQDTHLLSSQRGTWTGAPTLKFHYQWQRCDTAGQNCTDITFATATTYRLRPADIGSTVRLELTGVNNDGSGQGTSSPTAAVQPAPPANTALPSIVRTLTNGQLQLAGRRGSWTGSPTITYAYQWQRCDASGQNCIPIGGATGTTYTLPAGQTGFTIRYAVTATNPFGQATAASPPTAPIS